MEKIVWKPNRIVCAEDFQKMESWLGQATAQAAFAGQGSYGLYTVSSSSLINSHPLLTLKEVDSNQKIAIFTLAPLQGVTRSGKFIYFSSQQDISLMLEDINDSYRPLCVGIDFREKHNPEGEMYLPTAEIVPKVETIVSDDNLPIARIRYDATTGIAIDQSFIPPLLRSDGCQLSREIIESFSKDLAKVNVALRDSLVKRCAQEKTLSISLISLQQLIANLESLSNNLYPMAMNSLVAMIGAHLRNIRPWVANYTAQTTPEFNVSGQGLQELIDYFNRLFKLAGNMTKLQQDGSIMVSELVSEQEQPGSSWYEVVITFGSPVFDLIGQNDLVLEYESVLGPETLQSYVHPQSARQSIPAPHAIESLTGNRYRMTLKSAEVFDLVNEKNQLRFFIQDEISRDAVFAKISE